jgi:hypothetical protein
MTPEMGEDIMWTTTVPRDLNLRSDGRAKRKPMNLDPSSSLQEFTQDDNSGNDYTALRDEQDLPLNEAAESSNQSYLKLKEINISNHQQTREVKGQANDENQSQSLAILAIAASHQNARPFSLKDWDFLRGSPQRATPGDHHYQYLHHLNECKGEINTDISFAITNDQAIQFHKEFFSRRKEFKLSTPERKCVRPVKVQLYNTLLGISNREIKLERYETFSKGIMEGMKNKMESALESTENPPSRRRIRTMLKFVEENTKVTHLQIVAYMRLFNENKQDVLTESEVEEILKFMKELWFCLHDSKSGISEISSWAKRVQTLLNFEPCDKATNALSTEKKEMYHMCWNFASYFFKTCKRLFKNINNRLVNLGFSEVIDKMILYSNFNNIIGSIKSNQYYYRSNKRAKIET